MQASSKANPSVTTETLARGKVSRDLRKLTLLFVLCVLALSAVAGFAYQWVKQREIELIHHNLAAVADLKQRQITEWMAELKRDAKILTTEGLLAYGVEQWVKEGRPNDGIETKIKNRLEVFQKTYNLKSLQLLDSQGRLLMSVGRAYPPPALADIQQALNSQEVQISNVHLAEDGEPGVVHIDVFAPLLVETMGKSLPVGVLAYHINLADFLFPLIQSWPTPSATAETLLVRREGDQLVYLNDLRHRQDTALKMRLPLSGGTPASRALRGETGQVTGLDYRGMPVLADLRPIPGTDWFMVAKQDLDEIYRPARLAGWIVASLALALIVFFGLAFRFWYVRRVAAYALVTALQDVKRVRLEVRFASVLRQANDIILLMSENGIILDANERAFEAYGYPCAELIGMDASKLFDSEGQGSLDRRSIDFWTCQDGCPHETVHRRADGSLLPLEVNIGMIEMEGGKCLQAILRDITERKRAEADLREREAKYRAVIEAQADGFWMVDSEGRLLEVNDAYVCSSSYSREELLAMRVFDLEARETPADTAAHLAKVMGEGSDLFETMHRRKDGTVWQAEINAAYLPIADGCFCVFVRDTHRRERAESRWRTRMRLSELAQQGSVDDLLQSTLDSAELWTSSRIAFFHFVAPDQENLILQAWSTNTLKNMCQAEGKGLHQPISEAGVWVDCFHRHEPVIHNDYASLIHKKGLPEGYAPVIRMLTVPVMRDGLVVAIVGVGNKPTDYDQDDVESVGDLAGIAMDLVERKQAVQKLHLAASVFANTQEGIIILDAEANIQDVNTAFTELTGFMREDVLGQNPRMFQAERHDAEFYSAIRRDLQEKGVWRGEIWSRKKDGEEFPQWMTLSTVANDAGQIAHYIGAFSDITLLKQHEQRLEYMAYFDPLTGMPNRSLLADRMHQAIAQTHRYGGMMAIGYLDLDAFKPINDQFGHAEGDQLLIEISRRISNSLREGDTAARLGGDEFVVLLLGLEKTEECLATLRRLLARIAEPVMLQDQRVEVSASIGATLFPLDDADPDTLLRHADQAMYQAKQAGKNRFHIYDPVADSQSRVHFERLVQIETALANREFVLFYQPKVDLRSGLVAGVEALIRWHRHGHGLVLPGEFLPLIGTHLLGRQIDQWALEESLRQMTEWNAMGLDLGISINITAQSLQTVGFGENLADLLARFPAVKPGRCELEILESAALDDIEYISQVMRFCQGIGLRFALDDFGTGYSSLTYLKHLPAETIKIDQSFVRDMLEDNEDLAIVEGVIGLTRAFHRQVVAEGVETIAQGVQLIRLGCDLAQGYAIARPMPAGEIPAWVGQWKPPPEWVSPSAERG